VTWVVLGASGEREREARDSAALFLESAAAEVVVHGFRDGFLPYVGAEVKDVFEELKGRLDPDLILTHARADLHQDHRLVCELTWNTWRDHLILEYEIPKLTWNTWRDHLILEYEIPKFDGDLAAPNVFVPVSRELAEEKVRLLFDGFPSQRGKHWFDDELFLGLMRLRAMEAVSPTDYAEAFTCRKLSLLVG
jgi:LmbE family N-acetylglucosaminyl deacetylase